jgi:hypothetical protein
MRVDPQHHPLSLNFGFDAVVLPAVSGVMTLTPAILLMIIGGTVTTGSEKAGAGMFLGGFILAILALLWLGPSSYQMDVANGHVMVIRRHCIVRASVCSPWSHPFLSGAFGRYFRVSACFATDVSPHHDVRCGGYPWILLANVDQPGSHHVPAVYGADDGSNRPDGAHTIVRLPSRGHLPFLILFNSVSLGCAALQGCKLARAAGAVLPHERNVTGVKADALRVHFAP